jgi:MYXO-CTERM domain-containing protein
MEHIETRLAAILTLLLAAPAAADVAPPPPEMLGCPRGALGTLPEVAPDATGPRGRPLRAWPYCAPTTCTSDADCDGGRVCSEAAIGLCVHDREVSGQTVRAVRRRGCEPDGTCLHVQSTCERARRCVEPPGGAEGPTGDPVIDALRQIGAAEPSAPADEPPAESRPEGDDAAGADRERRRSEGRAGDENREAADGPSPVAASSASGCGCRAAPRPGGAPFAALAFGLAALLAPGARRRR